MFGLRHIITIIISIILVVSLYLFSRKMKFETICKYMFYIGIISEIVKIFYYIIVNEDVPFKRGEFHTVHAFMNVDDIECNQSILVFSKILM